MFSTEHQFCLSARSVGPRGPDLLVLNLSGETLTSLLLGGGGDGGESSANISEELWTGILFLAPFCLFLSEYYPPPPQVKMLERLLTASPRRMANNVCNGSFLIPHCCRLHREGLAAHAGSPFYHLLVSTN